MSARKSAAEAQAAKQKKILIGGAVLLVGVLAFQGPKMLKMLSGGSSSSSTPPPAAVAPPVSPAAVPGAPTPAPTPVSATTEPTGTKLVSFETFSTKDPFAPQLDPNSAAAKAQTNADTPSAAASGGTSSGTSSASASAAPAATNPTTSGQTGSQTASSSTGSTTAPTFKVAGGSSTSKATATISVNSKRQVVTAGANFPEADPVFTLENVASNSVSIAIAGGSLKAGGKTFTLTVGTPTTLLNTATGEKYKLELISTAPKGT